MRKFGLGWVAAASLACGASGGSTATTADTVAGADAVTAGDVSTPAGLEVVGKDGAFRGWLDGVAAPIGVGVELSATVRLRTSAGAEVVGATVEVAFIHTGMGHGGAKTPEVAEVGGGAYSVSGVLPSMAGEWALTLTVTAAGVTDTLTWSVEAAK